MRVPGVARHSCRASGAAPVGRAPPRRVCASAGSKCRHRASVCQERQGAVLRQCKRCRALHLYELCKYTMVMRYIAACFAAQSHLQPWRASSTTEWRTSGRLVAAPIWAGGGVHQQYAAPGAGRCQSKRCAAQLTGNLHTRSDAQGDTGPEGMVLWQLHMCSCVQVVSFLQRRLDVRADDLACIGSSDSDSSNKRG